MGVNEIFAAALATQLEVLHDRGAVNETAMLQVLQDLVDRKPLTLDHLTAIFGVAPIYNLMTSPVHEKDRVLLRARLDGIRDLVDTADQQDEWHALVRANLQLIALLQDELCQRPRWPAAVDVEVSAPDAGVDPAVLVREAYELLNNPETKVDLRDWLRAADPFVRS